ncbi:hypothetical protein LZG75_09440 [Polynucleobacter sp. IMCC30063]|nr:hypothetical protein [Polynucleobacter sp. IMCC 30228]MCE7506461.1 hypothetical protein [Polynucleobacter sp. IMCC30063]MCE7529551.1 hypothetical protein [Polynucleobacter sp. IMCC 29146]
MRPILDHPLWVLLITFSVLSAAVSLGAALRRIEVKRNPQSTADASIVQNATLTLLALMIGFTFSMSINRYDQRKLYEEAEANAIGTEYLRADLLPTAYATATKLNLKKYLQYRIAEYQALAPSDIQKLDIELERQQNLLWTTVLPALKEHQTPIHALVAAGMNDVINSASYTQAAWLNRIPAPAWALLFIIAIFASIAVGFSANSFKANRTLFLSIPLVVSVSFFLIADIDGPRHGIIKVLPVNLIGLDLQLNKP